jgi:FHA domain-containing protein
MIKLTVVSYNNEAPAFPVSATFGREGGTMGRSKDNYFVLDDPKNLVSRTQAFVKSDEGRHTITNLSHANPVLVNGHEIDAEREYDLRTGDEIQIGLYLLRVQTHTRGADTMAPSGGPAVRPAPALTIVNPHAPRIAPQQTAAAQVRPEPRANTVLPASAGAGNAPAGSAHSNASEPASVTGAEGADNQVLLQAFLKGAGIPSVTFSQGLTPELMETIGKLLAISVQGTIGLNGLRALVKREVNADVTQVVVRNNNPLKFFPDGETVLMQMLRKKMPGFMGPLEAMQDAYEDLHAHQLGVVAGMQAAMRNMLKRLNPQALDDGAKEGSFLGSMLAANRKAKLWDSYTELFKKVSAEAQDDFQMLFGPAFLQAYEAEIERFKNDAQNA